MRSDTRALLRIFVWAGVVVAAAVAAIVAHVLGGLNRGVAIGIALGVLLFGMSRVVRLGFPRLLRVDESGSPEAKTADAPGRARQDGSKGF